MDLPQYFDPNVAEFYYFNLEHDGHTRWSVPYDRKQHGVQRGIMLNVCTAHGSESDPTGPNPCALQVTDFSSDVTEYYYFNMDHDGHVTWKTSFDRGSPNGQRIIVQAFCGCGHVHRNPARSGDVHTNPGDVHPNPARGRRRQCKRPDDHPNPVRGRRRQYKRRKAT